MTNNSRLANPSWRAFWRKGSFWLFAAAMLLSLWVGRAVAPTWTVEKITLDVHKDEQGKLYYSHKEKKKIIPKIRPWSEAKLHPQKIKEYNRGKITPPVQEEYVYHEGNKHYYRLKAQRHWGFWSLLPAMIAILLAWVSKEPLTALFGGIISGGLILTHYDITGQIFLQTLTTESAASILILYLWFLGGLMGIWAKTGAAQAFARWMTQYFVKGPRSAKLAAWFLGVIFFQGGTVSTVLVGTTIKPVADENRISHEELSYVVDSTASPIASLLAFNAWPGYVQAFIFVSGVGFLATESHRIRFFFDAIPFCFYAMFAILGTFLLSIDRPFFLGKKLANAITRVRSTGELDAKGATPLSAKEIQNPTIPSYYSANALEFVLPLGTLIAIAIGTFIIFGSPKILWAFAIALLLAFAMAAGRGMSLRDLVDGLQEGWKGVVLGSVILLLAMTLGWISRQTGGPLYLVEQLSETLPYWALPVLLQILTMLIAFATGTSWGTYAVAFPLAMPLAWAVAELNQLSDPYLFMLISFAAVMDGSVYGDQCSPISDTTVLSSMCTGSDLMDHVRTQIPQATVAAVIAAFLWTTITVIFV